MTDATLLAAETAIWRVLNSGVDLPAELVQELRRVRTRIAMLRAGV